MNAKKLRIVFMGTPTFAVGVLDALLKHNYNVIAVITAPDKPSGRGRKLSTSAVKNYALCKELPLLQPKNLKDSCFLKDLAALRADLQIVVAFRMLPKSVWEMPKLGTINLHASLLPDYRGAAPINWVIINGETETGVTTFFIDEKIDTGEILLQQKLSITSNETAGTLHDRLMQTGSTLLQKTIDLIASGNYTTQKQPKTASKKAPKIYKDTCKIDWNETLVVIFNKIRGLNPYPTAWCQFLSGGLIYDLKIFNAHKEHISHKYPIGKIITNKKTVKVAVKDGYLFLDEIQLSGKQKMGVKDFLNGFRFSSDATMMKH